MGEARPYQIVILPRVKKRFKKLPKDSQRKIHTVLQSLIHEPFGGYQLKEPFNEYRSLKVKANRVEYRIIHQVKDSNSQVRISLIEPREEVYKKLKHLVRQ